MTLLVGGAVLLAVGAGVTLVLGWSGNDPTLVWVSLGSSALAAALLGVAARSRGPSDPTAGG
jgi:hypothetical protein